MKIKYWIVQGKHVLGEVYNNKIIVMNGRKISLNKNIDIVNDSHTIIISYNIMEWILDGMQNKPL